jgi:APA family basic amino acid/polyamine antiporter
MKLSTLSVLTPYLFSTASLAIILFSNKEQNSTYKLIIAFFAFCFSMWIIIGCGEEIVFWGFLLLMAGIPFYVLLTRSKLSNND